MHPTVRTLHLPPPYTLHPTRSTLRPEPYKLNPQPQTPNIVPEIMNPGRCTVTPALAPSVRTYQPILTPRVRPVFLLLFVTLGTGPQPGPRA